MKIPEKITAEDYRKLSKMGKINKKGRLDISKLTPEFKEKVGNPLFSKYHAQKTDFNGETYDSKKEAKYAEKLALNPEILKVERQVRYDLIVYGINCGFYKLDFKVTYKDGHIDHIDVKGMEKGAAYSMFRLKKKLMLAIHNIDVIEV